MARKIQSNALKDFVSLPDIVAVAKAFLLPLMLAIFPALFFYENNIELLRIGSLLKALLLYLVVAVFIFIVFCILFKGRVLSAANASFVFLIFFNLYGAIYLRLLDLDRFQVEHYTLFPFLFLFALYIAFFVGNVNPSELWKVATVSVSLLVVFNLFQIVSGEITKGKKTVEGNNTISTQPVEVISVEGDTPDIYFIVFDEFAGIDVAREYWGYEKIDNFVDFVEEKGFFVVENSQSNSTVTLHQMAQRLNYQEYPLGGDVSVYYDPINNSKVVSYLKSRGYVIVTFDEMKYWYDTYPPMPADYIYDYDKSEQVAGVGIFFDEFGVLLADKTMLRAFSKYYRAISVNAVFFEKHREFIRFTVDELGKLDEIPSPKFIRVHLMLPHNPFIFDENGKPTSNFAYQDWNYYFGQYKFTAKVIEDVINNILSNADPENPPVIIIQSDHGARNNPPESGVALTDYPDKYKTHILNILYIPGFDTSQLSQNMNPTNTFPIIFNYLFNVKIPLLK